MSKSRFASFGLLGSLFASLALTAGCGGSSTSAVECGPGTTLNGSGQCVPASADSGTAGMGGADSSIPDSAGGSGGGVDSADGGWVDSADGATDGGQDGTAVDADADVKMACPLNLPGPKLVEVSTPNGSRYCIDATEVTLAQYGKFLDAKETGPQNYDMSGEPAQCSGNKTYLDWPSDSSNPTTTEEPIRYTDWCDAYMFCQWAGKRLCGKVGGGALPLADAGANANENEWFNACSSGGKYTYPYGNKFETNTCVSSWAVDAHSVGSASGCHGVESPFDQIFDMSGNAMEWINACDQQRCGLVGGAYISSPNPAADVACSAWGNSYFLVEHYRSYGFRCCADVVTGQ